MDEPIRFPVRPETQRKLLDRMDRLSVREGDLSESFIGCSGRGGQKVNKTASGVRLRHVPSGVEVRCTRERSQALNRFFARRMLLDRLEAGDSGDRRQGVAARIRKQKNRRRARSRQTP